jgi:hypothetical protein
VRFTLTPAPSEEQQPGDQRHSPEYSGEEPSGGHSEDARLFYERLEQTGQLVDVDVDTDVTALPPRVTHVRYPDGTVERIGFATSSYGAW